MKYWKQSVMLLLLCLFSCSCGQQQTEETVTKTTKILTLNGITPMATKQPSEANATVTPTPTEAPVNYPINTEMEIDTVATNEVNRKLTRTMESGASLFCVDEEETIYFVNQNRDNYLYRRTNGSTELAVALPVKELYPFGEYVYFMVSEHTNEQKAGDIYRYNKDTKETELVYALGTIQGGENHKLNVNEQGIYFNYSETVSNTDGILRSKVSYYTLPFGATKPIKDVTNQGKAGWGDYYFSYSLENDTIEPVNVSLVNRTKEETIPLEIGNFQYCVVGDNIYSTKLGSSIFSIFHLKTQGNKIFDFRKEIIDANNYVKEELAQCFGEGMEEISSFTITENGNYVWVTDGEYLYVMDMTLKQFYPVDPLITADGNRNIGTLYTDGRRVYGLYSPDGIQEQRLVRFCVEAIETVDIGLGYFIMPIEYLVPEEGDIAQWDEVKAYLAEHLKKIQVCVKHWDTMQVQNEQKSSTTEQYFYLCGERERGEGIEEFVYQSCTVTTIIDMYENVCEHCNFKLQQLGCGEQRKHFGVALR